MKFTGLGLYTPLQASAITGTTARELRRWLFGYKNNEGILMPPLWDPMHSDAGEPLLAFSDLMELRVVKEFVRCGVPLRVIRASLDAARVVLGTDYPFTTFRFLTDGKSIFHEALNREKLLTDLPRRQLVFGHIIRPNLYAGIEFNDRGMAKRWFPLKNSKAVVLDPEISFGRPSLTQYGIPTEVIAQAYKTESDKSLVATQFDITVAEVSASVKYESQLMAA